MQPCPQNEAIFCVYVESCDSFGQKNDTAVAENGKKSHENRQSCDTNQTKSDTALLKRFVASHRMTERRLIL